jgi:Flp pilus assembly pilin Flp
MRPAARLLRDTRGANLVEYIVIVGLIAVVALGGFRMFGGSVNGKVEAHAACVDSLSCGNGNGNGQNGAIGPSRSDQIDQAVTNGNGNGNNGNGNGNGDDGGGGFFGWLGGQAKNFVKGGILGSFGGNTGWAGFTAKMIVGVIPVVGQIADARDTLAAVIGIVKDPTSPLAWTDLGAAAIGWVPLFGDAAKEAIRATPKVIKAVPWIQRTYSGGRQAGKGEPDQNKDK